VFLVEESPVYALSFVPGKDPNSLTLIEA